MVMNLALTGKHRENVQEVNIFVVFPSILKLYVFM